MGSSSSPDRAAPLQSGGVAPAAQRAPTAVASTSPRKKQVKKKGAHLPEVPSLIADVENGVEHVRGRLLGQVGACCSSVSVPLEVLTFSHLPIREALLECMKFGAQMVVRWLSRQF